MKNLLVTMSGGTTSVINATLAGIIKSARQSKMIDKIYAGYPGIVGFMNDSIINLTDLTEKEINILKNSPGSASIGTTRAKIFDIDDLNNLKEKFEKYKIGFFINIGGNGTIKQTKLIASHIDEIFVASAPKTVDNDLGDHEFEDLWFTPGFPSCVNYWKNKMFMLDNENIGASTNDKVLIAQTFGRETGFIVGSLRMYDVNRRKPIILLLPEDQRSPSEILNKIENTIEKHGRAIIGICEGYKIKKYNHNLDQTGQIMYGSCETSSMQQLVNLCNKNKIQARGYNPTVDQRQNFNFTLDKDIKTGYTIGVEIINNFKKNKSHFFQSYNHKKQMKTIPLNTIKNYSRKMKNQWIDFGNFDVSQDYVDYLEAIGKYSIKQKVFSAGKIL